MDAAAKVHSAREAKLHLGVVRERGQSQARVRVLLLGGRDRHGLPWAVFYRGPAVLQEEVPWKRQQHWAETRRLRGCAALGGSVSGASTARPKVASGVEQLQIIFMGDNKNVLPHNQH